MRIIPLIILIFMSGLSLGMEWIRHGQDKTGKYDAWGTLISIIIQWGLIIWALL